MNIKPILNIAEVCSLKGVNNVVISPGSRSAPITLGFANHPKIKCKIINDERSAGFIALGMALQLNETVALVCTSGTAVLNYAPAIAEAYYQQIPLLVITADRPPELIDQQDGQCLRQFEIFKNYIKSSFQTPDTLDKDIEIEQFYKTVNNAINTVNSTPLGPIHINVPIREPFYPKENIEFDVNDLETNASIELPKDLNYQPLIDKINSTSKVLFIAGQQRENQQLNSKINSLIHSFYPVIADINSNITNIENAIQMEELIFQNELGDLHPELVITFGNSILSKKLKLYFRDNKIEHYHIAETNPTPDFFHQLKGSFECKPDKFFGETIHRIDPGNESFFNLWIEKERMLKSQKSTLLSESEYSEPFILNHIVNKLPKQSHIHLANSMSVRWLNIIGVDHQKEFTIQSNRGVSGIDGSTSTALGYSIESNKPNFLITGDIAFFYDRNAFWNNYIPNNLKIILLNNHEGGIFNMIPGPNNNKETLSYFTSSQNLTAESLAKEFDLDYFYVQSKEELEVTLSDFLSSQKCSILELKTDSEINKEVLGKLKSLI